MQAEVRDSRVQTSYRDPNGFRLAKLDQRIHELARRGLFRDPTSAVHAVGHLDFPSQPQLIDASAAINRRHSRCSGWCQSISSNLDPLPADHVQQSSTHQKTANTFPSEVEPYWDNRRPAQFITEFRRSKLVPAQGVLQIDPPSPAISARLAHSPGDPPAGTNSPRRPEPAV